MFSTFLGNLNANRDWHGRVRYFNLCLLKSRIQQYSHENSSLGVRGYMDGFICSESGPTLKRTYASNIRAASDRGSTCKVISRCS